MQRLKAQNGSNKITKKVPSGKMSPQVKAKSNKGVSTCSPQSLVNGLPSHPLTQLDPRPHPITHPVTLPLHPIVETQPYTIEIDPLCKFSQSSCSSGNEHAGNFCLPSPLQSILGPIRTLHVFSETAPTNHRPVRQVRAGVSLCVCVCVCVCDFGL